jgi:hypothetical protein
MFGIKKDLRFRSSVCRMKPLSATELDSRETFAFRHTVGEMKPLPEIERRLISEFAFLNILSMD